MNSTSFTCLGCSGCSRLNQRSLFISPHLANHWIEVFLFFYTNCSTSPNPVIVACYIMLEKEEGVRVRECRGNLGVKRAIETGLGCPAPVPPIHPNVYTLSSTINGSQRLGCLPSTRPHGPFLGPYGCLIEHATLLIELTAWSLGHFPSSREGILSIWARQRDTVTENRGAGSCQNCHENVALAVDKAKLKMSTGGKQRSQSSWGQACQGPKADLFPKELNDC